MRIKVVILVNELLRGGAQRMIADLARTIDKERFDLCIVTLKDKNVFSTESKTYHQEIESAGVPILSLQGGARVSLGEFWRLKKYLTQNQPDVVHTFLPYAGILGRIAARWAHIATIISTQCNLPVAYTKKLYWLDRLTLPLAHAWTGATEGIELHYGGSTEYVQGELIRRGRRHFTIVSGVDVAAIEKVMTGTDRIKKRHELAIPLEARLVFMTARLMSWKGHEDAIAALANLPASYHIAFAGWGPLEASLREQARRLGVIERVHFLGVRRDIYELLAISDIYLQVFSYTPRGDIWAGPNISLMEAAAAGVPIVASRIPLIEKLVEDQVTGRLAEVGNPAEIAQAIRQTDASRHETAQMVKKIRQRIYETYSVNVMTRQHELLYEELMMQR